MNNYNEEQPIAAKSDNDMLVESVDNLLSTKLAEIKNNENLKMRLIRRFSSLPTNILKMSKYYYSVQFDGVKSAIFYKNVSITYRNNIRKVVSIHSYLKHLFINRKYKKTSTNAVSITYYGIYNVIKDDQSKALDKFEIVNLFGTDPKNGYEFFVDYYTICRVFRLTSSQSTQYSKCYTIKIEFIGLNANKYYRNIYRIATHIKPSAKDDSYNIITIRKPFTKNGDRFMQSATINLTNFNNICCKDGLVDLLKKKVSSFIKAGELYAKYQINNTFGILFYGVPGTGKTSLIKSVMHYSIYEHSNSTKRNSCFGIYSLDVSVSSKELSDAIGVINDSITDTSRDYINDLYIIFIIIEEIDSIMNASRNNDNGEINSKIKILLEFLDGMNTPNGGNIIFLASTNYYEKLDPALIRCGRFDLKIEMEEFGTEEIDKMCKIYNIKPEDIYNTKDLYDLYLNNDYRVSPAALQSQILSYLTKDL